MIGQTLGLADSGLMPAATIRASNAADDWGLAGLPRPLVASYSYTKTAKVNRTKMSDGSTMQRVLWRSAARIVSVSFSLTSAQLVAAETLLSATGASQWGIQLPTGASGGRVALHLAEQWGDWQVSNPVKDRVKCSITLRVRPVFQPQPLSGTLQSHGWTGLGFPIPSRDGYSYSRPSGLVRSSVESALTPQAVLEIVHLRAVSAQVRVPYDLLGVVELALDTGGYNWFSFPLLTGLAACRAEHMVRLAAGYSVASGSSADEFGVTLPLEVKSLGAA